MYEEQPVTDAEVGVTRKARKKSERFYPPSEARKRVNTLRGDLYCRVANSDHDDPEMHLHDPADDWVIVFVVGDDKPIIVTMCHNHWDYPADDDFTYIGGGSL